MTDIAAIVLPGTGATCPFDHSCTSSGWASSPGVS